ncbi:putative methyltransferase-domain-containing protein [Auriculariales sp. MPI-PUGE-AT-0066]|nr:putative methyltransferase-domain-containing protein [Auriculariales sp. MPI-PUGE-AT-0066]
MPGLISAALVHETLELPSLLSSSQTDLGHALSNLRSFLTPPIYGFAHRSLRTSNIHSFDHRHALRWLTSLASRFAHDESYAELVDEASALIAMSCGASTITRTFVFRDDLHVLLNDAPIDSDGKGASVGLQTWGSSFALANALANDSHAFLRKFPHRRLRILELGAGTGLVGLTLAKLGIDAEIIATDHHPRVLINLKGNVALNGLDNTLQVDYLDWSTFIQPPFERTLDNAFTKPFDLIFAADVVYEVEQCGWLVACVTALLEPNSGVFHLVVPTRPTHAKETRLIDSSFPPLGSVTVDDVKDLVRVNREDLQPDGLQDGQTQIATFRHYTIVSASSARAKDSHP